MTALSTTTLLELVNQVLLDVGERQVTSISQPFSRKAEQYIKEALIELQHLHDWEWLYSNLTPTSWTGNTASLSNVQRIIDVAWDNTISGGTYKRTRYLKPDIYDLTTVPTPFDSSVDTVTCPVVWTIPEYNKIKINPYPTDFSGQARVKVYAILSMSPPSTPTGLFPVPEFIIPLLRKRATYLMYVRHLGDAQGAALIDSEFNQMLHMIRNRQAKHPIGGQLNMYKSGRRYR